MRQDEQFWPSLDVTAPYNASTDAKAEVNSSAQLSLVMQQYQQDNRILDVNNNFLSQNHIDWFTIPPWTPHFGGLWQTTVKSMKHHLYRTVGLTKLSTSAFTTLLAQIEAILNSRPLTAPSTDINDPLALTPVTFHHRNTHRSYTRAIFTKELHLVTTLEKHRQIDSSVLKEMECGILIFIAAAEQMEDRKRTTSSGR